MAGQVTIGIDMGGTKVLGLAVDDEGVVLAEVRVPSPGPGRASSGAAGDGGGPEPVIEVLASVTQQLRQQVGVEVASVGVGAPGLVDNTGVLRYAPNLPPGNGLDIVGGLSARLGGLRTVVDNDATCATAGGVGLRRRRRRHRRRDGDARHRHRGRGDRGRARGARRVGLRG